MATTQYRIPAEDIDTFLRNYYREEIAELAQAYPNDRKSLFLNYDDLFKYSTDLTDDFARNPGRIREFLEEGVRNFDLPADVAMDDVNVRVYNAPSTRRYQVGEYRSDRLTEFIAVEGQIAKQSAVKPLPTLVEFECQRCGTRTAIPQLWGDCARLSAQQAAPRSQLREHTHLQPLNSRDLVESAKCAIQSPPFIRCVAN